MFSVGANKKTRLVKYLEINSYLYMFLGLSICIYPTFLSSIGLFPEVIGREIGLLQVIGFTLFLIGYFYFFGARTEKDLAKYRSNTILSSSDLGLSNNTIIKNVFDEYYTKYENII